MSDSADLALAGRRILIIKLGALGDVIRTTPLLHKLNEANPRPEIWWLTLVPEILPKSIDRILTFTPQDIATIRATRASSRAAGFHSQAGLAA